MVTARNEHQHTQRPKIRDLRIGPFDFRKVMLLTAGLLIVTAHFQCNWLIQECLGAMRHAQVPQRYRVDSAASARNDAAHCTGCL